MKGKGKEGGERREEESLGGEGRRKYKTRLWISL